MTGIVLIWQGTFPRRFSSAFASRRHGSPEVRRLKKMFKSIKQESVATYRTIRVQFSILNGQGRCEDSKFSHQTRLAFGLFVSRTETLQQPASEIGIRTSGTREKKKRAEFQKEKHQ